MMGASCHASGLAVGVAVVVGEGKVGVAWSAGGTGVSEGSGTIVRERFTVGEASGCDGALEQALDSRLTVNTRKPNSMIHRVVGNDRRTGISLSRTNVSVPC